MNLPLVCTSKNIWAELSYEFGPSCLINFGRVGMGRVLCGPSFMWAELARAELSVIPTVSALSLIQSEYTSYSCKRLFVTCSIIRLYMNFLLSAK